MFVPSTQRILLGTHCILVGILHTDYTCICLLFVLLVLGAFYRIGSFEGYSDVCLYK
jgi:hypothetical protein